jgi:hypothetical protein
MKVEIEIPDPPEGWKFDGHRKVVAGEIALFHDRQWSKCQYSGTDYSYLVCVKAKPLWEPSPELLAVLMPGWIAKDSTGQWLWYLEKPRKLTYFWEGTTSFGLRIINSKLLPPDSIPWDQCCFKIGEPQE